MDYLYEDYDFEDDVTVDMEDLFEDDFEDDPEFDDETGPLRKIITREKAKVARKPTPAKVAQAATKVAGAAVAKGKGVKAAVKAAKKVASKSDGEWEMDLEAEAEMMLESNPEALELYEQMEYFADMAAEAESEAEADQWIGALASVAAPLISSFLKEAEGEAFDDVGDFEDYDEEADEFFGLIAKAIPKIAKFAAPLVKKGIGAVGKFLRSKRTRRFVRQLPKVALNTAASLAQRSASGRPISPSYIAATLGRNTYQTFGQPSYRYSQYRRPRSHRRSQRRRYPQARRYYN